MFMTHAAIDNQEFRSPTCCGFAFRDGKCYSFEKERIVVMRGGLAPAVWVKALRPSRQAAGWFSSKRIASETLWRVGRHFSQRFDLPVDLLPTGRLQLASGQLLFPFMKQYYGWVLVALRFQATIPPEILVRMQKTWSEQWQLYCLLAYGGQPAIELFDANPALAWALANGKAFTGTRRLMRKARSLLGQSQRKILGWLGFPPHESVRRMFGKLHIEQLQLVDLLRLRTILARDDKHCLKLLCHAKQLDGTMLDMLSQAPHLLTARLLDEVYGGSPAGETLRLTLNLADELGEELRTPFISLEHLTRKHKQLQARRDSHNRIHAFPPPPHLPPPESGIHPIVDSRQLAQEGTEQANCCASYAGRILHRRYFIYQVERPIRATLGISRRGRRWHPDEVRQKCNLPVPPRLACQLFETVLGRPVAAQSLPDNHQLIDA